MVTPDGCTVADSTALQGFWTQAQYLKLTNQSNRLLEFTDGRIEALPMPTQEHQAISRFLFLALYFFAQGIGGNVFYAPCVSAFETASFVSRICCSWTDAGDPRCRNDYWIGADLVVEVVSPDNPDRDLIDKRKDYAEAGIPEYWIANPHRRHLHRARSIGRRIQGTRGVRPGEQAGSPSLPGFSVDVREMFDTA